MPLPSPSQGLALLLGAPCPSTLLTSVRPPSPQKSWQNYPYQGLLQSALTQEMGVLLHP